MKPSVSLRRLILPALFVAALFAVVIFRDRPQDVPARNLTSFSGPTMGTTFSVKVVAPEMNLATERAASDAIHEALDAVDRSMSTWREDSEIMALNRAAAGQPVEVSRDLLVVTGTALEVADASGGAFDPTVGPLVRAWGFGADGLASPPTPDVLEDIRRRVGWQHLILSEGASTISKGLDGMELDLSAIAKGHAVDRVFAALTELGHQDLMVEIGGEVRARGTGPTGGPWRIGIEVPDGMPGQVRKIVPLSGRAMATSGDYRNYREVDGVRLSHTIDPRSGAPVRHGLASVTVFAPTCMAADAWATALNVLGPEEGPQLAEALELPAYFIVRSGDGFSDVETVAFGNLVASDRVVRTEGR